MTFRLSTREPVPAGAVALAAFRRPAAAMPRNDSNGERRESDVFAQSNL